MKKISSLLLSLAIVALSVQAQAAPLTQPPVQTFIVKMKDSSAAASLSLPHNTHMGTFSAVAQRTISFERNMSGGASVLRLNSPISPEAAEDLARQLAQQEGVEYVSPNYRRYPSQVPPTDPDYAAQWHLHDSAAEIGSANVLPAWGLNTGTATVIAVVDTGVIAHPDLNAILLTGYDFYSDIALDNDGSVPPGRDADPSDPGDAVALDECGANPALPASWHGTHVSGIIAAIPNNGQFVAGINWAARILPVRVLGKCGGLDSDILDGVRWAAGQTVTGAPANANPAKIINLSLGGGQKCTVAWESAISDVSALGVTLVYAAGNENQNVSNVTPAGCSRGITVAATTITGDKASFSNFGTGVDIAAPGGDAGGDPTDILSTASSETANTPTPTASSEFKAGTSMAAPVVSGVLSLILAENPALTPIQLELIARIFARAFPTGSCTTSTCGAGIIDAARAVQAASDGFVPGSYTGAGGGFKIESLNGASTGGSISWLWLLGLSGLLLVRRVVAARC